MKALTGILLLGALILFSCLASATQILSSKNLSVSLFYCHGEARLDLTAQVPRLFIRSSKCRYIGQEDGQLSATRTEGFELRKGEVRLITVQSPSGTVLDSFLVDTRL